MKSIVLFFGIALSAGNAHAQSASPYAPLAFLAGHCWKGEMPGRKDVDTHCFSWIYGSQFVRDRHVVHGTKHADYLGESIYYWDGVAKKLQYLYVESDGGSSSGSVETSDTALIFPEATYQDNGKTQTYRSTWKKSGADAYDVVTEFKRSDAWVPGWTVHMQKTASKP